MSIKGIFKNNSILKKLFNLFEDDLYENTDTNRKLTDEIVKAEEQFFKGLTSEQQESYDKICDLKQKNYEETDKNIFIYAFKMGAKTIIECVR